ncbi:ATPase [Candidatus Kaiserbacteria bacterium]|nr:ATPase [Candidatus Kaiserbacteria bacterium]
MAHITKADGTTELFKAGKLRASLRRAGASQREVQEIITTIEPTIADGMTTQEIYQHAFALLREHETPTAAKYSLRRAIFNLGPTGFPFEDFLARLFEAEGYITKKRQIIKGKCATHEIDIAAYKDTDSFVAEAKFHARPGIKSDIQVAMYSYARFLDLQARPICAADRCGINALYVITNTKFTRAAVQYAECVGIKLLDWYYPRGNSLQDRIEAAQLYPITALTTLSVRQKQMLIEHGIILCTDILRKPRVLGSIGIPEKKRYAILEETQLLCG